MERDRTYRWKRAAISAPVESFGRLHVSCGRMTKRERQNDELTDELPIQPFQE